MTDDVRDLLAGDALDALDEDDKRRLEQAVGDDAGLESERDAYRATVAALDAGVARMAPSDDLFDRILGQIEAESAPVEPRVVREPRAPDRSSRWSGWLPRLAVAGAAAAAVLVVALVARDAGDVPDARAAVAGTEQFPDVAGTAELFSPSAAGGVLRLQLENLPAPPEGAHYEVWVLREEAGEAMEAVGSFTPSGADAELELPLPGPGDFRAVDISVEPDGGSAAHSGVSLAGGTFS